MTQLTVTSPRTGEPLETYPVATVEDVATAVAQARVSATWWRDLGVDGRRDVLDRWRGSLARRLGELTHLVAQETGKPHADAELEIGLALDHLAWAAKHAGSVLAPERVPTGPLLANHRATIHREPYGVVGVIGPWNYPVFTPMGSIIHALAAGNAVVFKPSELTPGTGLFLARTFSWAVPGQHVFLGITGDASTGEALCRSGVDKIAFTGSSETATRVLATCAETLTPVVVEAGGKDALIVAEDGDVEAAAEAAAWGAFSNAGQTCLGVERVYVHARHRDAFVERLLTHAEAVRHGMRDDAQYGPMTLPRQVDVIREHVDGAIAAGARVLTRGREEVRSGDDIIDGRFVSPTVLLDVPDDADAMQRETFGPTCTVTTVASDAEAVERANAVDYGLGASVFSRSNGEHIAAQLRTGCVSINSVITFAAVPSLPLGGRGRSGFGRIHGADGLREFSVPKAVTNLRFPVPIVMTSFTRGQFGETAYRRVLIALNGARTLLPDLPAQPGRVSRILRRGR